MLTQARVKELFIYKRGKLIRRKTIHYNAKKGDVVGCPHGNGYLDVRIDGERYYVHRVIFLYHYGYMPKYLDHKYGKHIGDYIWNLRECTQSQNGMNRGAQANNNLGIKNISFDQKYGRYRVLVKHAHGRVDYSTKDLELAEFVASEAREKYHGEFAHA